MRLSLKNVYKRPHICGRCEYSDNHDHLTAKPEANITGTRQESGRKQTACKSDEVAFWVENEHGNDSGRDEREPLALRGDSESCEERKNSSTGAEETFSTAEKADMVAEKVIAEKMEQYISQAYEQGKTKAIDECRLMREDAATRLREAELSLREARQRSREIVASSEKEIVELALAVAERLVRTRLEADPEIVTAIVRETMSMLNGGEQVDLYVNPADLDLCLGYREQLKEEFREIVKLEVLPDTGIPRGSCRVESEIGVAEYLINEEKEQLRETLLQIARKEEMRQIEEEDSAYDRH
jgi:flagellar assembly protein FliH